MKNSILLIVILLSPLTNGLCQDREITSTNNFNFQTVKIGNQKWMAENLNVITFRNGDLIQEARTKTEWENAFNDEEPAWCYYNNEPSNDKKYGKLYNWYAVNDSRGLAPTGWKIPSDKDWSTLTSFLGGEKIAGKKMKASNGWNNNGGGDNSSGFSGLPGGERLFSDSSFYHLGNIGFWWTSSRKGKYNAIYRAMHCAYPEVGNDHGGMNTGFSVRCIRE
jgi:uncharacterized protein (TIGR02145 family)